MFNNLDVVSNQKCWCLLQSFAFGLEKKVFLRSTLFFLEIYAGIAQASNKYSNKK